MNSSSSNDSALEKATQAQEREGEPINSGVASARRPLNLDFYKTKQFCKKFIGYHLTTHNDDHYQDKQTNKNQEISSVGEDAENPELLWGVKWHSHVETSMMFPRKLKHRITI